jgi:hypothetical protein
MKTIKQTITDNKQFARLINAVVKRIGKESIEDVINHGADCGFNGFIYYSDTHKFAMYYRKDILELCEYMVDAVGYKNVHDMVMSFRCVINDNENYTDLCKYIGGGRLEQCTITNAMAWFALEEVCRMFED